MNFPVASAAIIYGITIDVDSASVIPGVVAAAPAGYRGTTLAVHSTLGSRSAFLGPLTVGVVLDFLAETAWPGAWDIFAWQPDVCWDRCFRNG